MLLIYTDKITYRVEYTFKFILTSILGIEINLTTSAMNYIDHSGPKMAYMKYSLKNGLFFEACPLLFERGIKGNIDLQIEFIDDVPYFFKTSSACAIGFDIFAASFYLISRYEEYLPYTPDEHQRFPAKESLAYRKNFIQKPIVDIWAMQLLEILKKHFPDIPPPQRSFKLVNIFSISKTWAYREMGIMRNFFGALEDLLSLELNDFLERMSTIFGRIPDPLDVYQDIITYDEKYPIQTILFFLVAQYDIYDQNVSINSPDFRKLIKFMADHVKIGLCASYASTNDPELLMEEKKRIENILHRRVNLSIQHLSKIHLPNTYKNLIELDIQEDYSMGYHDHTGFRASTCTPFLFYDLKNEALTSLKIFPFSASIWDLKQSGFSLNEILQELLVLMREVKAVKGPLILLMNNEVLSQSPDWKDWKEIYETFLETTLST